MRSGSFVSDFASRLSAIAASAIATALALLIAGLAFVFLVLVGYALVRGALEAKIARPVFYRMVEWAEERDGQIGLVSQGTFFPIVDSAALEHGA